MLRRLLITTAALLFLGAPSALASGGAYTIEGGSAREQLQVRSALNASAFPWSVVPGTIAIHVARGVVSHAVPGAIWLDADVLDTGRFSWGVVQHEYGHQVDFALLDARMRDGLLPLLGGVSWWGAGAHASAGCERFADLVSFAWWESSDNVMRPTGAQDESAGVDPAAFRAALATLLPQVAVRQTAGSSKRP